MQKLWSAFWQGICNSYANQNNDIGIKYSFWTCGYYINHTNQANLCSRKLSLPLCSQCCWVYLWASALCICSTIIPPCLTDQCNFITVLIVTREPEQTTLLFWSAASGVTPHGFTQLTGDSRQCAPFSNLFFSLNILTACLFTYSLFTYYCTSPFYALSYV